MQQPDSCEHLPYGRYLWHTGFTISFAGLPLFLPMISTRELSELFVTPSIPKPSVGLWLPMRHQTAKGRDSIESTGIAVASEVRA